MQKNYVFIVLILSALSVYGCGDEATNNSGKLLDLSTSSGSDTAPEGDAPEEDATPTGEDASTSTNADIATAEDATNPPTDTTNPPADTTNPPADTTTGCANDCDCPQGEACLSDGTCLAVADPRYCCDNAGCPSGEACSDAAGDAGTCPGCTNNCDCPQGEACGADGSCLATTTPVYCCDKSDCPSGEVCSDAAGTVGSCPACVTHCDCPQGEACTADGACVAGVVPTYCCDGRGCPAGEACTDATGQDGVCPATPTCTTHCDCPQGQGCTNGVCATGNFPTYCCTNPGCPSNTPCQDAQGGFALCPPPACAHLCDCEQGQACNNGECRRTFNPTYCCENVACPATEACVDRQDQASTCPVVATSCTTTADCAPRGPEWVCDTNASLCYDPGSCDANDATIAPCKSGTCNFGFCQCDAADPASCRDGEVCSSFSPTIPGVCTAN